jgi:hypothetical protein
VGGREEREWEERVAQVSSATGQKCPGDLIASSSHQTAKVFVI